MGTYKIVRLLQDKGYSEQKVEGLLRPFKKSLSLVLLVKMRCESLYNL